MHTWKQNRKPFPQWFSVLLKHVEAFSWRSSTWISWFPPLMFWFHQPGKKQYILICYCHHRLAPVCQFLNLGERCYTQEGHRFKSEWHSTRYLSRELVIFRFDPSPCSHFSFSWFVSQCSLQKKNPKLHQPELWCERCIEAKKYKTVVDLDSEYLNNDKRTVETEGWWQYNIFIIHLLNWTVWICCSIQFQALKILMQLNYWKRRIRVHVCVYLKVIPTPKGSAYFVSPQVKCKILTLIIIFLLWRI